MTILNQKGFINILLLIVILVIVGGSTAYIISKEKETKSIPIDETSKVTGLPISPETNQISVFTQNIVIQLQINGSSENSITLKTGEDAVITWDTKNANQCFSEGKGLNAWPNQERTTSGRYVASNISLAGETQFILICKNGNKTESKTIILNVVSNLSKSPSQILPPKPTTPSTPAVSPSSNQPKQKILEKFATIIYDGPIYSQGGFDGYRVSRKFYETHPDSYDFIVVYSAITTNFQSANGLTVKNGIRGNGSFYPDQDDTAKYGSNGKLLGYIFIPTSLGLDAGGGVDLLEILAHEVSHHWLMFIGDIAECKNNPNFSVKCAETPTGFSVSRDGAHWSSNVDTLVRENGAVYKNPIGGLAWQMNSGGYCSVVPATSNGIRFNDLDLYLMGFLPSSEAKSIYWYDITDSSDLGQKCTQHTISAQDIINMEGTRQPAYPAAQRDFKIGFILLTAPGQTATQQQISRMNYIIDNFSQSLY